LTGLIILAIGLHAAIIIGFKSSHIEAPTIKPPLSIEMAAPPKKEDPPPPEVKPKPLRPAPVKHAASPKPAPVLPVVRQAAVDEATSSNSVQVATTPQPAPPPPEPVVEKVTEPKGYAGYLNNPAPNYPSVAQKRGWEGQVMLKVHVLASGQPDSVTVAKSSGYDMLDQAAVKAVTAWTFMPAKRGQTPVDGWVQVPLTFKL
jgi:protein TonB